MRSALVSLLVLAAACRDKPKPLVDPELAAYLPPDAPIVAGVDVDALRKTPLFERLPGNFRDASYVLAALDPPNLVTAARVQGRVVATGATVKGAPPDLVRHATAAPVWMVVRGTASLPLSGNLSNINRLLRQTAYTRVSARVGDNVEFAAEGVCATPEAAAHLEQNVRAIATLAKIPLEVRVDGSTVHVAGSMTVDRLVELLVKP